jgi:hypothetical protein
MSAQFLVRLTLASALALASACGDDPIDNGQDVDPVGDDDSDDDDPPPPEPGDDDDAPPADDDDDEDDDVTPPPPPRPDSGGTTVMRDAGPRDGGLIDSGSRDTGTPTSSEGGSGPVTSPGDGGGDPPTGSGKPGECCPDGKCLCHGMAPSAPTNMRGPYMTMSYSNTAGCIYYPTNAEAPFAAVAISDGFGGSGGCGRTQTDGWGPLYASWGIVAMIINTGSGDQPNARGTKLNRGIAAFKMENTRSGGPLMGKLAGRYGTSGFSMGGGGTSYASAADKTLLTSVAIMPWGPVRSGVTSPTLVICGSSDGIASCASHGNGLYSGVQAPKMKVTVQSGHAGQPTAGSGRSGQAGLAWQKVYLEGDIRWKPVLNMIMGEKSMVQ